MREIHDLTDKLNDVDARIVNLNKMNEGATAAVRQLIRYFLDEVNSLDIAETHLRSHLASGEPSIERLKEIGDRHFSQLAILQAARATYNGY